MRKIKFRFYSEVHNKMISWDKINKNHLHHYLSGKIDNVKAMQFTGLHDKNRKEIYFGDVLQTPTGIATVVWQDIAVALQSPGSEAVDWEHSSYYTKCKIIGNVHENPELLTTKK